jgi:tetratricopeptide (TPR) repeat protein
LFDVYWEWAADRAQALDEANRFARKSLELDDRQSGAHDVLAHTFGLSGQREEMIASFERALELNPNDAASHGGLGLALSYTGRPDEAIVHLEQAMRLSPQEPQMHLWLTGMGFAHFSTERYEEAAEWFERSRRSLPSFPLAYRGLAATYAQLGRMEKARAALQGDLRLNPHESVSHIKAQVPVVDPDFLEPWLDALRKAGLKE